MLDALQPFSYFLVLQDRSFLCDERPESRRWRQQLRQSSTAPIKKTKQVYTNGGGGLTLLELWWD